MDSRPQVVWFGKRPQDADIQEAKNRGLEIHHVASGASPMFRHARAAVFWATPPYLTTAAEQLSFYVNQALDEGLYVHIVVGDEGAHDVMKSVLAEKVATSPVIDRTRIRIGSAGAHEALESAARHSPGPGANDDLIISLPEGIALRQDQVFILRRAFSDCKAITLQLLTGGKSGALTFYVDAVLAKSNAGPRPMPYFAKLDRPSHLAKELALYENYADNHIAWHLRPNFQPSRCIYGVDQGVLVGNFVESSRSLWDIARAGQGPRCIRSLFEETLAGWRSQAEQRTLQHSGSVVSALKDVCDHTRIPKRCVTGSETFGEVAKPRALWLGLLDLPHAPWRSSPMHGDMHGENVRVRKGDAIVIDFAKATNGPMCADLASLEVWLAFQTPVLSSERPDKMAWKDCVDALYHPNTITDTFDSAAGYTAGSWIEECVCEIRRIAKGICQSPDEYMRVLAVYLLRHASFQAEPACQDEDEFRRSFAYWLANRMVKGLAENYSQLMEAA